MAFMNIDQLNFFGASAGAYSDVTLREATGDKSITVDRNEKQILYSAYPPESFTRAGGSIPDGKPAKKMFHIFNTRNKTYQSHELAIKYPKKDKTELRLYFRAGTNFYPTEGKIWFIFHRAGENVPYIGEVDKIEWELLGKKDGQQKHFDFDYSLDEEDNEYQKAIASPKAQGEAKKIVVTSHKRDAALAAKSIINAKFKCQFDSTHESFISASTDKQYMEVHHLIPISRTPDFDNSLDVEGNLIVLCPNCHRAIHYGSIDVKQQYLDKFFDERSDILAQSGLTVDLKQLYEYYGIEAE